MIQAAILGTCLILSQVIVGMNGGILINAAIVMLLLSVLFTLSSLVRDGSLSHLKATDLGESFQERDQREKQVSTCLGLGVITLSGAVMLTGAAWLLH